MPRRGFAIHFPAFATPAEYGAGRLQFEFLLFFAATGGLALGAIGVAAGVLDSPAGSMVIGDWYLMTSGLLIVAASSSRRRTIVAAAGGALACMALAYPALHLAGAAPALKPFAKASVALSAAAGVVAQFVVASRERDPALARRQLRHACFAVALVALQVASGWGVQATTAIGQTFDRTVLLMDDTLGARIPALLRDAVTNNALAHFVVRHVYISLPLAMVGYDLLRRDFENWTMTKLLLVSSMIGFCLYFVTPVAGTTFLSPAYDSGGAVLADATAEAFRTTPRNCMPSLHTSYALFLILASLARQGDAIWSRLVSAGFVAYGVLTIVGAMVYGDHYAFDCIVALPFATAIYLTVVRPPIDTAMRGDLTLTGATLFVLWVAIIRADAALPAPLLLGTAVLSMAYFGFAICALVRRPHASAAAFARPV